MRPAILVLVLGSLASLACGPGKPGDSSGDGDPGDGDPSDGDPGDGDSGDGGFADAGHQCGSLGFMMAHCDGQFAVCLDSWTCHFYDTVDIYGVTPVGNCSPPCETDADCAVGIGDEACFDPNIVCSSFGSDPQHRCVLPCKATADCYPSQFCAPELGICVSNST
jgi:hypothetical protein